MRAPTPVAVALILVALPLAGCIGTDGDGDEGSAATSDTGDTLAWTAATASPTPRTEATIAVWQDRIYAIGGFTQDGSPRDIVEVYDPATDSWEHGPAYPMPIHHTFAVTIPEGEPGAGLYVVAGDTGPPVPGALPAFIPTNLAFRLTTDGTGWEPIAPLPDVRAAHGAAYVDGRIFVAGGFNAALQMPAAVLAYDPATDTWETATDLPTPREHVTAAALDGKLYVPGGELGSHADGVDVLEAYDPASDTWETLAPMPTARGSNAIATWDGRIVVLGGQNTTITFPQVEAYDPATNTWETLPDLPTPRHGFGAGVVGNTLYAVLGGPEPGLSTTGAVETLAPRTT